MSDDPKMPPVSLRYLANPRNWCIEITCWAHQIGLRNYCWVHDRLRWAWTHRNCARLQHEHGQRIAAIINRGNNNG